MASKKSQTPEEFVEATIAEVETAESATGTQLVAEGTSARHTPGTAPANPLVEPPAPNIRLRHVRGTSEYHVARTHVPTRDALDGIEIALPTLADGTADQATQERGWYCEYAHRILESPAHAILYAPITPKGQKP